MPPALTLTCNLFKLLTHEYDLCKPEMIIHACSSLVLSMYISLSVNVLILLTEHSSCYSDNQNYFHRCSCQAISGWRFAPFVRWCICACFETADACCAFSAPLHLSNASDFISFMFHCVEVMNLKFSKNKSLRKNEIRVLYYRRSKSFGEFSLWHHSFFIAGWHRW